MIVTTYTFLITTLFLFIISVNMVLVGKKLANNIQAFSYMLLVTIWLISLIATIFFTFKQIKQYEPPKHKTKTHLAYDNSTENSKILLITSS